MSYSYPSYVQRPVPLHGDSSGGAPPSLGAPPPSALARSSYRLFAYVETHGPGARTAPLLSGVPILFLPGSGGSYQQVRSLASETAKQAAVGVAFGGPLLDWFTLDFREELSAFDGSLLERQRQFLLDVLVDLGKAYAHTPAFMLVGHSMGGVVARSALSDPRLPHGAVGMVLTLAAPHASPWLAQLNLAAFYTRAGKTRILAPLVTLSGGVRDWQVPPWLAALDPPALSVSSHSLLNLTMDHQCIVWCHQVVAHVSAAILNAARGVGTSRLDAGRLHRLAVLQAAFEEPAAGLSHILSWRDWLTLGVLSALPMLPGLFASYLCDLTNSRPMREWESTGRTVLMSGTFLIISEGILLTLCAAFAAARAHHLRMPLGSLSAFVMTALGCAVTARSVRSIFGADTPHPHPPRGAEMERASASVLQLRQRTGLKLFCVGLPLVLFTPVPSLIGWLLSVIMLLLTSEPTGFRSRPALAVTTVYAIALLTLIPASAAWAQARLFVMCFRLVLSSHGYQALAVQGLRFVPRVGLSDRLLSVFALLSAYRWILPVRGVSPIARRLTLRQHQGGTACGSFASRFAALACSVGTVLSLPLAIPLAAVAVGCGARQAHNAHES